jgi:sortase system peptidoglycan-associated protein
MIKQTSLALAFSLAATTAAADTQHAQYQNAASSQENTGFFSGALLGGLAGGPPGAIAGAFLGAILGDGQQAKSELGHMQAGLYESQSQLAALKEKNLTIEKEYQLAQQKLDALSQNSAKSYPATASLSTIQCCDNTVLSLNFRTGSNKIEDHYEEQLNSLVSIARAIPTVSVEITGYTDRNGDSDSNLKLSQKRSNAVKKFFISKGFQNTSIKTIAYGETRPLQPEQSFESDFFDRRVIVRLRDNNTSMLTHNPD